MKKLKLLLLWPILAACSTAPLKESRTTSSESPATRSILLVGNAVAGTISVIDTTDFKNLGSINVIPDLKKRLREIKNDFARAVVYETLKAGAVLQKFEPDGGKRYVDDVFVSPDGGKLYVSRGNLGDVAAFDLTKDGFPMIWRTVVENYKADHATISPDGKRLVVSALLAAKAQVLDTENGQVIGEFATGTLPHQNDYSANGERIYNGSIGRLDIPDYPGFLKGYRQITVVDAQTLERVKVYRFDAGVRPTVITNDEKTMYLQLSHLNGVVKYDLVNSKILKTNRQPFSDFARRNYKKKSDYPHDSAHHGLALSGDGKKLCDSGTIDNTVTIISTENMRTEAIIDTGMIPYWSTTSPDGHHCFVSLSGESAVAVISYDQMKEIARIPVDKFPQRSRLGLLSESTIARLNPH